MKFNNGSAEYTVQAKELNGHPLKERLGEAETVVGEEGVYTGDPPRIPAHNLNKIQNRWVKWDQVSRRSRVSSGS